MNGQRWYVIVGWNVTKSHRHEVCLFTFVLIVLTLPQRRESFT